MIVTLSMTVVVEVAVVRLNVFYEEFYVDIKAHKWKIFPSCRYLMKVHCMYSIMLYLNA